MWTWARKEGGKGEWETRAATQIFKTQTSPWTRENSHQADFVPELSARTTSFPPYSVTTRTKLDLLKTNAENEGETLSSHEVVFLETNYTLFSQRSAEYKRMIPWAQRTSAALENLITVTASQTSTARTRMLGTG